MIHLGVSADYDIGVCRLGSAGLLTAVGRLADYSRQSC